MDIMQLLTALLALLGVGGLFSALINLGKIAKLVTPENVEKWIGGLNLVGLIGMYVAKTFFPDFDIMIADEMAGDVARILTHVTELIVMVGGSKLFHTLFRGFPVLGKSFSLQK